MLQMAEFNLWTKLLQVIRRTIQEEWHNLLIILWLLQHNHRSFPTRPVYALHLCTCIRKILTIVKTWWGHSLNLKLIVLLLLRIPRNEQHHFLKIKWWTIKAGITSITIATLDPRKVQYKIHNTVVWSIYKAKQRDLLSQKLHQQSQNKGIKSEIEAGLWPKWKVRRQIRFI